MSDIKKILETTEKAVNRLSQHATAKQSVAFKLLISELKKLDANGDTVLNSTKNWKLIQSIKVKIGRLLIDPEYRDELKTFVKSYGLITDISNQYFSSFNAKFGAKKTFNIITQNAIETTITSLTEVGVDTVVTDGVMKLLQANVSTGGSYADLTEQVRAYMLTNESGPGAFERYVDTYARTAINQFAAEYNQAISDDLGLEWYGYSGSLLETSREFCEKCVEKKYIHVSEFETILRGDFGQLGKIRVSKSSGLPPGLMKGTDKTNLVKRRGGWNCGHQMIAIDEAIVPQNVKNAVYNSTTYQSWAAINGKQAKKST